MSKTTAIEINSRETWDVLCAIQPLLKELSFDFNRGFFFVVEHDNPMWKGAIVSPATVAQHFDRIAPATTHPIRFVNFVDPK